MGQQEQWLQKGYKRACEHNTTNLKLNTVFNFVSDNVFFALVYFSYF